MSTVQLGIGAYERLYAGEPVIRLENRFVEANPTNLREQSALLARPGTQPLEYFTGGRLRRTFSKDGLFNSDLFTIAGPNLWRYAADGTKHLITGIINGEGPCAITWLKGIGYERLFIADGLLLQYYDGGTHAIAALTLDGTITDQVISIGDTYYTWGADVDANDPDGSAAHPFIAKLDDAPLASMARMLMFAGTRGVDYSATLGGPSTLVTATVDEEPPETVMRVTSIGEGTDTNLIAVGVTGDDLTWDHATLEGGGVHVLHGINMPDGKPAKALATVASFVLVSVARSQQFFFLRPGEIEIDPLDYYSKESNPDAIIDMMNVGDQAILLGSGSTETWYATGDLDSPFEPIKGRAYQRGMIEGTACVVKDSVLLVGNDGVVYEIGIGGISRVSNHGIEERIRVQRLRENGEEL